MVIFRYLGDKGTFCDFRTKEKVSGIQTRLTALLTVVAKFAIVQLEISNITYM